VKIKSL